MTNTKMPRSELIQKSGDDDFLRSLAESVLQVLMEADVEGLIGAGRHERTGERQTYHNRALDTRPVHCGQIDAVHAARRVTLDTAFHFSKISG